MTQLYRWWQDYKSLKMKWEWGGFLLGLSVWQRFVLCRPCCSEPRLWLARAACQPWGQMVTGGMEIWIGWKDKGIRCSHPLTVASTAASSPTRSSPTGASRQTTRSFLFSMWTTTWWATNSISCCCTDNLVVRVHMIVISNYDYGLWW